MFTGLLEITSLFIRASGVTFGSPRTYLLGKEKENQGGSHWAIVDFIQILRIKCNINYSVKIKVKVVVKTQEMLQMERGTPVQDVQPLEM